MQVTNVVLSVPTFFTQTQRLTMIDAAMNSGLNVIGLINETSAAAYDYYINNFSGGTETVLFFDLGGGSLSTSIVK